ncbi:hypothetical protein EMIT093MI4_150067 [Pseudomonas sp. IT-93MI4]
MWTLEINCRSEPARDEALQFNTPPPCCTVNPPTPPLHLILPPRRPTLDLAQSFHPSPAESLHPATP